MIILCSVDLDLIDVRIRGIKNQGLKSISKSRMLVNDFQNVSIEIEKSLKSTVDIKIVIIIITKFIWCRFM